MTYQPDLEKAEASGRPYDILHQHARFYRTSYSDFGFSLDDPEGEHGNTTAALDERMHYHHDLDAGESTLGAGLLRVLMRSVIERGGYSQKGFLDDFIRYMTQPRSNRDPYTEIYLRRWFEHYSQGTTPENCAEHQRRVWSIGSVGGLVRPLVLALLNPENPFVATGMALGHWSRLLKMLGPSYYPDSLGKRGRPPIPLKRMLRMYFVRQWHALSDEALEDAIYDSQALRNFVGVDLAVESVPDATTLLKFRHMLEKQSLTQLIFEQINAHLAEKGMLMREGSIVDATIIAAPPSTKNRAKARDPEMHQAEKGNQWHFGMKAHIGVDADSGLVHSLTGTAANVADITESGNLLQGDETDVFGDAGYTGVAKRASFKESTVVWHVAEKRGKLKKMEAGRRKDLVVQRERVKAQIRSKVEHPFHVIKNLFRHRKVRYRGLLKNTAQLFTMFGLANLVLARRLKRPQCA